MQSIVRVLGGIAVPDLLKELLLGDQLVGVDEEK
jgi:hypothetical protein